MYEPIEPVRLSEVVVERLQQLVIGGQLKEGDRLPSEADLARQFGVSRTAIREAIRSLVEQGVVVVRQGSGTYVDRPDQRPLQRTLSWLARTQGAEGDKYLVELRQLLEPGVCALAAVRATEEDVAKMKEAAAEMKRAIKAADSTEIIVDADLRFHQLIGEASQNPLVGALLDSIADLLRMQRLHYSSVPGAPERAQRYHDEIAKIVALHKPDEAYHAMQAHLRQVMHDVEGAQRVMEGGEL